MGLVRGSFDREVGLHLVREELLGVASSDVVASLVFGAMELARLDDLPSDVEGFASLVEGPLRDVIARRLGDGAAHDVTTRIVARLEQGASAFREVTTRRTAKLDVGGGPLAVLVISTRPLGSWLRAALAADFVDVRSLASVSGADTLVARLRPAVIIVDATEEGLKDPPIAVARWLSSQGAARVVWAGETAWAKELSSALGRLAVDHVPVDPTEGVSPLLDLVRSRRA